MHSQLYRLLGIPIIEDTEPAWFPANELREVHGIVPHEPTEIERTLFCIQADGSEGFCCPTYVVFILLPKHAQAFYISFIK